MGLYCESCGSVTVPLKVVAPSKVFDPLHVLLVVRIVVGIGDMPGMGVSAEMSMVDPSVCGNTVVNSDDGPVTPMTLTIMFHAQTLGKSPALSVQGRTCENEPLPSSVTTMDAAGMMTCPDWSMTGFVGVKLTLPVAPAPLARVYVPVTVMVVSPPGKGMATSAIAKQRPQ